MFGGSVAEEKITVNIIETGVGVSRCRRLVRLVGLVRERCKNNVVARCCEPNACQRVYIRDDAPSELPAREKFMKKFLPPREPRETASRPTATNYLSLTVRITHRAGVVRFSTASRLRFLGD